MFAQFALQARLIFRQLWSFLRSHKKLGLISFIIITSAIITSWFVFAPFAQAGWLSGVGETIGKAFAGLLFLLAGFCIKLTFFVLKFIIEVAGYNGFIDSPAVTVGWVMIRDLTNMFFVVVLLMIAFGTILGLDHYEWKHMLFKLVTAAVLVNFSRLICGLIIDVAQIVMVTFLNGIAATASGNLVNMFQVDKIFKLGNGDNFTGDTPSIFIASVAAIMFSVTMLITMVAFLFIIVARMAMLWVLIVVSPFAFVLNVLHQTEHFAGEWWGKFNSNVVSGPVIAFFLWLSFVTVGSGNIHDDIVKHNSLKQGQLLQESSAPAEEQTGITEVMSWENMGNFIIAIAILMAGAKMAEELSVAGAHMMSSASELGKKAAMYASGFQAAKWAAPKIAMKVPLIGGEAWQRRGQKIAAIASYGWGKVNERRDNLAKSLGEKGIGGKLLASAIESKGRKEKRVEDWKKAAKLQQEIVDENYSVSSDSGGKAKLRTDIRLKKIMKQAEGKKQEKYAKEEYRMNLREKIFHAEHELDHADTEEKSHLEEEIKKLTEQYEKTFKEKVGRQTFDDKVYAKRGHTAIQSKAKGSKIEHNIHREHELEEAEERDRLEGVGGGGYADQVRAKHAKEDQERAAVGSWDKSMNRLAILSEALKNPKLSNSEREQLLKQRNNLQMANIKRGQLFGVNGQNKILEASGITSHDFTAELDDSSLLAQQANFLSTQLNKQVAAEAGAISHAVEELAELMGPGYMEQMVDSLNTMADDAAVGFAGMFKTQIDPEDNKTKVLPTRIRQTKDSDNKPIMDADGKPVQSDLGYIQGKRDWAVSQSKLGKLGFEGSIDREGGKAMIKSAKALENISNMFAGLNRNNVQRVDANAVATLVTAIKNSGDRGAAIMQAIARQADPDGVRALLKRINENLVYQNEQLVVDEPPPQPREGKGGKKNNASSKDDDEDDEL